MRRVWTLFLVLLLSVPASVVWATPTQFGNSGLISQPSADTHQSGSICIGLWGNYATIKQGAVEKSTFVLPVSVTLGLGSFIEAYGSYPNLTFNGDEGENITGYPVNGYSDRGFANLGLKLRLLGSRSGPFRFAVDGQARRNISTDPTLDGLTDYLTRGIITLKYGMFGLHANGGLLRTDAKTDADHVVYGGGLEFNPMPRLRLMAEYETTVYDGNDPVLKDLESPAEATFGMQFHFSPHLAFSAAYSQGLSDFSPDWRTIIGFYTCQGTGTYIKPLTSLPEEPEEVVPETPEAEPVKMLKLNTLAPMAPVALPETEQDDPISKFEVPVKAGGEEIVIEPASEFSVPEGVERVRDEADATPSASPDDSVAIPFTTVMAASAAATASPGVPTPMTPVAVSAPDATAQRISGGRSYELNEFVYAGDQIIGQKIEEEPDYKTYFLALEPQGDYLVGEFYHDASHPLPVWVEGDVDYTLSFKELAPFTMTRLRVKLDHGKVPAFRLHIGEKSEVFQFGPPEMWDRASPQGDPGDKTSDAGVKTDEGGGGNLAVKVGKGIVLAPVAIVAAPFVGAAYLFKKATGATAEVGTEAVTTAASTSTGVVTSAAVVSAGTATAVGESAGTGLAAGVAGAAVSVPLTSQEAGTTEATTDVGMLSTAAGSAYGAAVATGASAGMAAGAASLTAQGVETVGATTDAGTLPIAAGSAYGAAGSTGTTAGMAAVAVPLTAQGAETAGAATDAGTLPTAAGSAYGAAGSTGTTAGMAADAVPLTAQGAGTAGAMKKARAMSTAAGSTYGAAGTIGATAGAGTTASAVPTFSQPGAVSNPNGAAARTQSIEVSRAAEAGASTDAQTAAWQRAASGAAPLAPATFGGGQIPLPGGAMETTVYRKYRLPEFTFELGLAELSAEGRRALSLVVDSLRKMNKWFLVRIDGHTDSTGSANYNEKLAMERTVAVASYLVTNEGLDPQIIFLKGYGERKPVQTNATPEGRQQNRRIELLILIPKEN